MSKPYPRLSQDSPGHLFTIPLARRQVENLMRGRKISEPPRFMTVTRMSQAHGVNQVKK